MFDYNEQTYNFQMCLGDVRSQFRKLPHAVHVEIVHQLFRDRIGKTKSCRLQLGKIRDEALARSGIFARLHRGKSFQPLVWKP